MATIGNDTEQYSDTYGYFRVITFLIIQTLRFQFWDLNRSITFYNNLTNDYT